MRPLAAALVLLTLSSEGSAQTRPDRRPCDQDVQALLSDAKTGDAHAMLCIGIKYSNTGSDVPRDEVQATSWFRKAADAGQPSGMFFAGVAFWSGRGVTQDMVEAYKWLDLSAKYGDTSERDRAVGARDSLARVMTPEMIAQAKKRESQWEREFQARRES